MECKRLIACILLLGLCLPLTIRAQFNEAYLRKSIMLSGIIASTDKPAYEEHLKMIEKLQPTYLSRVGGSWGTPETALMPGGDFYKRSLKFMDDIKHMYRKSKRPMPMFEAGIYEAITTDVNKIRIPDHVIRNVFKEACTLAGYKPGLTYYFHADSMRNLKHEVWGKETWPVDLTRLHTRMWWYVSITNLIDMGYESIHIGWFDKSADQDTGYVYTHDLLTKIRKYAKSKGKKVYFNADVDRPIYLKDTKEHLLDFISSPVRPTPTLDGVAQTPCELEPFAAFRIDPYHTLLQETSGILANGKEVAYLPILFNIDWYGISYRYREISRADGGNGYHPYKVNETIWFYQLSTACQQYWLQHMHQALKDAPQLHAYFKIPGLQPLAWWGHPVSDYMLWRTPVLQQFIVDTLWN